MATSNPFFPTQFTGSDTAPIFAAIRQMANEIRVAIPGFLVEDIDATAQTITAQVSIQEYVRTLDGPQWWDADPIIRVPVILPRGGGFSLTLPLKKGDEGLLIFCDMCFDNWWVGGVGGPKADNQAQATGSQRQLEFEPFRRHHIHDCGFLPG